MRVLITPFESKFLDRAYLRSDRQCALHRIQRCRPVICVQAPLWPKRG